MKEDAEGAEATKRTNGERKPKFSPPSQRKFLGRHVKHAKPKNYYVFLLFRQRDQPANNKEANTSSLFHQDAHKFREGRHSFPPLILFIQYTLKQTDCAYLLVMRTFREGGVDC